jgi:hypothetical protein
MSLPEGRARLACNVENVNDIREPIFHKIWESRYPTNLQATTVYLPIYLPT